MRAPSFRTLPLSVALLLASSAASAQVPPGHPPIPVGPGARLPLPPNFNPLTGRAGTGPDCAVSAMNIEVTQRREVAMVDMGVRVRGIKGGPCVIRPDALQVTTRNKVGATRLFSYQVVNGTAQKGISVLDAPAGGDRPRSWAANLKADEEQVIVYRVLFEGDVAQGGEVDAPSRARIDLRSLGPRVLEGAAVQAVVRLEGGAKGSVSLNTGNPRTPGMPRPVGPDGSLSATASLGKDDLIPVIEWKHDAAGPAAATSAALADGGLAALEYLRVGLVSDLAASFADPKDEKKIEQGWDTALDAALGAARSEDALVAGLGARAVAWLASGLSASSTVVRAPDEAPVGDAPAVPAKAAVDVSNALTAFLKVTSQKLAPSPAKSQPARLVLSKLGETGAHKKEAEEALKRLGKRLDGDAAPAAAGVLLPKLPLAAVPPSTVTKSARVVFWGPKGPQYVVSHVSAPPKAPLVQRIVRGMSHRKPLMKGLLAITLLGAGFYGLVWAWQRRREATPATA